MDQIIQLIALFTKIEGYKWIIKQRQNKLGGGIAIMINNNIQHITKVKQDTEENKN